MFWRPVVTRNNTKFTKIWTHWVHILLNFGTVGRQTHCKNQQNVNPMGSYFVEICNAFWTVGHAKTLLQSIKCEPSGFICCVLLSLCFESRSSTARCKIQQHVNPVGSHSHTGIYRDLNNIVWISRKRSNPINCIFENHYVWGIAKLSNIIRVET